MEEKIKEIFQKYNIKINKEEFIEALKKLNISVTIDKMNKLAIYYNFLLQENEKFNLTSITEQNDVIFKHFLDSVLPIDMLEKNKTLIDIGSGAGFPGIPIKIMRPDLEIVLVDSLQKRVNFLNNVIKLLNLQKITAIHARIEDFAIKNREKFDYALSRAVAQIPTLSEYMLPLVKIGGKAIMYKSQKLEEELSSSHNAIKILGGKVEKIYKIDIKDIDSQRSFLILDKIKPTPKIYPRGKT